MQTETIQVHATIFRASWRKRRAEFMALALMKHPAADRINVCDYTTGTILVVIHAAYARAIV